jgi:glutathionylspermidine synthase
MKVFCKPIDESKKDTTDLFDLNNPTEKKFVEFAQLEKYVQKLKDYSYIYITKDQENKIKQACEDARKFLYDTCKYVLMPQNEYLLKYFDIDPQFWDRIRKSYDIPGELNLYSRMDLGYSIDGEEIKVFENNMGCCGFLYYTSVIQNKFYLQFSGENVGKCAGGDIVNKLTEKWKQITTYWLKKTNRVYFLIDNDTEETCITMQFSDILRSIGVESKIGIKDEGLYIGDDGKVYDKDDKTEVELIFTTFQWNTIFHTKLTVSPTPLFIDILLNDNINLVEPAWISILGNKALLAVTHSLFSTNPLFLATHVDPNDYMFKDETELIEKHVKGRASYQVKVVKRGEDGKFHKDENCIYQKKFTKHIMDGQHFLLSPFLVGHEYAGFCMKVSEDVISDYDCNLLSVRIV